MIAINLRAGPQAAEIGSRIGLGKALAPDDFAFQDSRQMILPLRFGAFRHEGRTRMVQRDEAQVMVGRIRAGIFLVPDELPRERQSESAIFLRPGDARPAGFILQRLPGEVECAGRGPGVRPPLWRHMLTEPVARLSAKRDVVGREVQVQPVPRGILLPGGAYSSFKKMTICHFISVACEAEKCAARADIRQTYILY
jgi:hypothetical protein